MDDLVGKTIERYNITGEIGRGGMAVVYRAVDTMLDRNVAIKIIMPEYADKEKLLKRFNREAKSLAKLSHSNIVKVLDYGEFEGAPYLVMEYIPGGTLSSRMGKPMNYAEAAVLLAPVARALNYAHQQKVVHRDVKPGNILINESGQALLSDFGILKLLDAEETQGLTGTGKIVGTPSYMSPEQIRGGQIDGRADIYSLGIVFFEMVTGRKPYIANTPIELSLKHLNDPIPRARQYVRDLPPEVEQIFLKAMAKKPEERYQSMAAFADDLEKLGRKFGAAKPATGPITVEQKLQEEQKPQSKKAPVWLIIPLVVVMAGAAYYAFSTGMIPGFVTPTATISPTMASSPSPTFTATPKPVTATPVPTILAIATTEAPTIEAVPPTITPTPAPVGVISLDNVARLMEINKVEKISVISLGWAQNDKWIVDAGSGAISFIDPAQMPKVDHKISLAGEIPVSIAISPTDIYVLIKTTIQVYNIDTQKMVTQYSVTGGVHSIALSPNGKYLALGISDSKVQLLDPATGNVLRNLRSSYGGWSVAFSPDSGVVVSGNNQGALMWETETGTWLNLSGGQENQIKSVAFSKDGKMLAGGSKGTVFIWDVATGDVLHTLTGDFGNVNCVDFSPDDSLLVAGADDGAVLLWDVESGAITKTLAGHTSPVFGAYFSASGKNIVSGANEGVIRLWGIP